MSYTKLVSEGIVNEFPGGSTLGQQSMGRLAAKGDYFYQCDNGGYLLQYYYKNPGNLTVVNVFTISYPRSALVVGNTLYVLCANQLVLYDVTNEAEPIYKQTVTADISLAIGFFATENRIYIGLGQNYKNILIYDLASDGSIALLSNNIGIGYNTDILIINGLCFSLDYNNGYLHCYDVSRDMAILKWSFAISSPCSLAYDGRYLYVYGTGFTVFDLINMNDIVYNLQNNFGVNISGLNYSYQKLCYHKGFLFVIDNNYFLDIFDASNPSSLKLVAQSYRAYSRNCAIIRDMIYTTGGVQTSGIAEALFFHSSPTPFNYPPLNFASGLINHSRPISTIGKYKS